MFNIRFSASKRTVLLRRSAGYSLIELMVTASIGLLLILGVVVVLSSSGRNYREDSRYSGMQDELRFALGQVINDTEMSGFWSNLFTPSAISADGSLPTTTTSGWSDCGASGVDFAFAGFSTGSMVPIAVSNNLADGAAAHAAYQCIDASEFQADTDVLTVRRVVGDAVTDSALVAGTVYLRENGTVGILFLYSAGGTPPTITGTVNNWPYRISVYYIRNYSQSVGDGVPALCRKSLQAQTPPAWTTECIGQGIENLQVEFGIDPAGTGTAAYYRSAPSAAELSQAVTTRISLLARSSEQDYQYSNGKRYALGDVVVAGSGDHYYRKALASAVVLRNPAALLFLNTAH